MGVGRRRVGGGGELRKTPRGGEGPMLCIIFYLDRFVFTSWLLGAFDSL